MGVKISCAETPNSNARREFYAAAEAFLGSCGLENSDPYYYLNQVVVDKGVTVNFSSGEGRHYEWFDLTACVDGVDFSDEELGRPLVNYGSMAVSGDMPVVTWSDIVSGTCDNQTVYIDGVVDDDFVKIS